MIDFCGADQNRSSKSLARYFQSKKRKSKVVHDRRKREKNSSISSASVAAGLFPNLSCLVSLKF